MPITTNADLLDGQLYIPGQVITLAGSLVESSRTGINKQGAVIPFGYGVCRGTNDSELVLPVDGNSVFRGIAKLMQIEKRSGYSVDGGSRFGVPIGHEFAFVESGDMAVYVDGDVTEGAAVYLNHTASSSVVGVFRGAANSGNAVLISGAYWLATVTGGTNSAMKVAPLRINRP